MLTQYGQQQGMAQPGGYGGQPGYPPQQQYMKPM